MRKIKIYTALFNLNKSISTDILNSKMLQVRKVLHVTKSFKTFYDFVNFDNGFPHEIEYFLKQNCKTTLFSEYVLKMVLNLS